MRSAHRNIKKININAVCKMNAVILFETGWVLKRVKNIFLLGDKMILVYTEKYRNGGIHKLMQNTLHGIINVETYEIITIE